MQLIIYKANFTIQIWQRAQRPQQEEITCLARSIRDVSQSGRRSIYMAGDATCVTDQVRDRNFLNKHEIHNLGI